MLHVTKNEQSEDGVFMEGVLVMVGFSHLVDHVLSFFHGISCMSHALCIVRYVSCRAIEK